MDKLDDDDNYDNYDECVKACSEAEYIQVYAYLALVLYNRITIFIRGSENIYELIIHLVLHFPERKLASSLRLSVSFIQHCVKKCTTR